MAVPQDAEESSALVATGKGDEKAEEAAQEAPEEFGAGPTTRTEAVSQKKTGAQRQGEEEEDDDDEERERPKFVEHVVLCSDTLAGICLRYGVKPRELERHNSVFDGRTLNGCETLRIPWRRGTRQTETKEVLMQRFKTATRLETCMARYYLDASEWDVSKAIAAKRADDVFEAQKLATDTPRVGLVAFRGAVGVASAKHLAFSVFGTANDVVYVVPHSSDSSSSSSSCASTTTTTGTSFNGVSRTDLDSNDATNLGQHSGGDGGAGDALVEELAAEGLSSRQSYAQLFAATLKTAPDAVRAGPGSLDSLIIDVATCTPDAQVVADTAKTLTALVPLVRAGGRVALALPEVVSEKKQGLVFSAAEDDAPYLKALDAAVSEGDPDAVARACLSHSPHYDRIVCGKLGLVALLKAAARREWNAGTGVVVNACEPRTNASRHHSHRWHDLTATDVVALATTTSSKTGEDENDDDQRRKTESRARWGYASSSSKVPDDRVCLSPGREDDDEHQDDGPATGQLYRKQQRVVLPRWSSEDAKGGKNNKNSHMISWLFFACCGARANSGGGGGGGGESRGRRAPFDLGGPRTDVV